MTDTAPGGDGARPPVNAALRQGLLWNLLNFLFSQGAGIVIFIVLSRAVSPAMFGVFAIAAILVDLFTMQGRWAAMDALIQRQDFSKKALSTAFFSLSGVAITVVLIAIACAGLVANAFEEPSLGAVLPALAVTLLFMPPTIVMEALIMRRLQFRASAIRSILGTLIGGAAGIAVAFSPAVEWALVAQRIVAAIVTLGVLFVFTRWLPSWEFARDSALGFLRRAGQLWTTSFLATVHVRVVEAAIGLRISAEALGLLTVARRFETVLYGPVTGPIQGLWVPVLSVLRDDKAESWRLFLRLSQLTAFLALPVFLGVGLVAQEIVELVLDPRYAEAGPILAVLMLQGVIIPVGFFANLVFAGLDRSDLSMKLSLIMLAICTPAVWVAAGFGPVAALLTNLVVMGVGGIIATLLQIRMMHGRAVAFIAALAPAYVAAAAMAAAVTAVKLVLPADMPVIVLIGCVSVGALVYGAWLFAFHRKQVLEAWRYLTHARKSKTAPAG